MKYYKVYRKCCRVAKSVEELSWEEFDQSVWNEAWEDAYVTTEQRDDEEDDEWLDKVESRATSVLDKYFEQAQTESGLCAGDFYLYVRGDDTHPWDMKRPD